jgi:digeranylgeranylglycerophospholipid reductase
VNKYDVVIVGAGPVGSYTAYLLADKGFDVCLIDEKKQIGENVICAGVIGKQAFKRFDLPGKSILSRLSSATFISPSKIKLEYDPKEVIAYVVDRKKFDKGILKAAEHAGVDVHLKQRVNAIKKNKSWFHTVITNKRKYRGRIIILATGIDYKLNRAVGLGKPVRFFSGSQIELPISFEKSNIQIHISKKFAPGSFGWVIPAGANTSRIGLLLTRKSKPWLKKMLEQRLNISVDKLKQEELKTKPIAFGPIKHSVKDNILAVGEAAGQLKTTTGGGIFFGLLCSEICTEKITNTLRNGANLNDYETTWRSVLASEFDIGILLRNIAAKLNDDDIENLFKFVKKNRFWVNLVIPRINFDYHSDVIYFCIKSFSALFKIDK